jgi:phenylalanyl-tRNA synthetase beta chain
LAGRGLVEAITWSFIPEAQALAFGGSQDLRLANPISNDLSTMRPSLLPGLISAAKRNIDRGFNDFGLFEVGNIFHSLQAGDQSLSATAIRDDCDGHNNRVRRQVIHLTRAAMRRLYCKLWALILQR